MKRPTNTVIAVVGGIVGLIVTEVIVWWPDPPKKRSDDAPSEPARTAEAKTVERPPTMQEPRAPSPSPATTRSGRDIPQLRASETDEIRRLEGCSDKRCGDQCIFRCDPKEDGRCAPGYRPGACTMDGQCSTTLPAVCPPKEGAEQAPPN